MDSVKLEGPQSYLKLSFRQKQAIMILAVKIHVKIRKGNSMIFETVLNRKKKISPWYDLLTEWIEKLEAGEMSALRVVYSAFASGDPALIRRAGAALQTQLSSMTRMQLLKLCECFRTFTSLEWSIDWADIDLEPFRKELTEEAYQYVLILGSFHPNGYFREACIRKMADQKGMLFWLFPRVNDWVLQIRSIASMLLETRLTDCDEDELIACLPVFERLQNCRRRTGKQIQALRECLETRLSRTLKTTEPKRILRLEPAIRAALYRIATQAGLFDFSEMEVYLELERMTCLKRILIRKIFSHPNCILERAEHFLKDRSSLIRRMAVEFRYEHLKDCWPGLELMLLDKNRGVREYAAYILERRSSLNIRGYYLAHLGDAAPDTAILGLAEYSHEGNVSRLLEGLNHPDRRTVKCTLLALGEQKDFTDEALLWHYVLDDHIDLSKSAYLSIRKKGFYPGAARIYGALLNVRAEHHRQYLLKLLLRESSWERLPYLLLLYRPDLPGHEKEQILSGIRIRSMYQKVSESLCDQILQALKQKKDILPSGTAESILYDIQFIR